jgi:hypothetical protein
MRSTKFTGILISFIIFAIPLYVPADIAAQEGMRRTASRYPYQGEIEHLLYEIEGWYFGEIHPEAYMALAKLEVDQEKAIQLYDKIIRDYAKSRTGKSGSDAVASHSVDA